MSNLTQQHIAMIVYTQEERVFPTLVESRPNGKKHHWAKETR